VTLRTAYKIHVFRAFSESAVLGNSAGLEVTKLTKLIKLQRHVKTVYEAHAIYCQLRKLELLISKYEF
jgi:hypothetical protein